MPSLCVMCGISGSGKSSYAKVLQENLGTARTVIVSTDELRAYLYGDASCQKDSDLIFKAAYSLIEIFLTKDYNVIFDATNLMAKDREAIVLRFKDLARLECYACVVPYELAVKRQGMRDRKVPSNVIRRQYLKFVQPTYQEGWDYIQANYQ